MLTDAGPRPSPCQGVEANMHQLAESHNALLRDLSHNVTVAESTYSSM